MLHRALYMYACSIQVDEITHLIASQASSIEAVRLKCLLQPAVQLGRKRDFLAKHEVTPHIDPTHYHSSIKKPPTELSNLPLSITKVWEGFWGQIQ